MIPRVRRFTVYAELMRETAAMPFELGINDSATFVTRAVQRLLGIDHTSKLQPYARRVFRAGGVVELMTVVFGQPEPTLDKILICDPCVASVDDVLMPGLWSGTRATVFTERQGLHNVPPESVVTSWRVS